MIMKKLIFGLFLVSILGIFVISFASAGWLTGKAVEDTTNATVSEAAPAQFSDTDNGLDFFTKGAIMANGSVYNMGGGSTFTFEDSCAQWTTIKIKDGKSSYYVNVNSSATLKEVYVANTSLGLRAMAKYVTCTKGCKDGACNSEGNAIDAYTRHLKTTTKKVSCASLCGTDKILRCKQKSGRSGGVFGMGGKRWRTADATCGKVYQGPNSQQQGEKLRATQTVEGEQIVVSLSEVPASAQAVPVSSVTVSLNEGEEKGIEVGTSEHTIKLVGVSASSASISVGANAAKQISVGTSSEVNGLLVFVSNVVMSTSASGVNSAILKVSEIPATAPAPVLEVKNQTAINNFIAAGYNVSISTILEKGQAAKVYQYILLKDTVVQVTSIPSSPLSSSSTLQLRDPKTQMTLPGFTVGVYGEADGVINGNTYKFKVNPSTPNAETVTVSW
jgi:hypothetical protein